MNEDEAGLKTGSGDGRFAGVGFLYEITDAGRAALQEQEAEDDTKQDDNYHDAKMRGEIPDYD